MDGIAHDELYPYAFQNKHWSGLLIEPVQSYFEELKKNYENRNNLIFENVAIADTQDTKEIYTVNRSSIDKGDVPFWCNGISTLDPNNKTINRDDIKDKIETQQVRCCTFEHLVQNHNIQDFDILQIDAEGYDYLIFQQIWNLGFRPQVIHIEVVHMKEVEVNQLCSLLQLHSYQIELYGDNLTAVKIAPLILPKKKRVAFYTYPQWAFGAIHSALCKELYTYGLDADIFDWNQNYTKEEWQDFNKVYDVFVTVPGKAVSWLLGNNIPYNKIIAIAHGKYDIEAIAHYNNDANAFLSFGVIAQSLEPFARQHGITRDIKVLRNGIQFDRFYQPVAQNLSKIGYASSLKHYYFDKKDCKRSYLLQQVSEALNLPIVLAQKTSYLMMPQYYSEVDCVMVSSNQDESCSLPLMEAAASGRLPISAKIGIASEFDNPPGLILPLDEKDFVSCGVQAIKELMSDQHKFQTMCKEAQDFAKEHYDWKHVIEKWIDILTKA